MKDKPKFPPRNIDRDCKHPRRYRFKFNDSSDSACALCTLDRMHKQMQERVAHTRVYEKLFACSPMTIPKSGKVIMWFPHFGYSADQERLKRLNINLGDVFEVESIEVGDSHSYLKLKKFPGQYFNTVNFGVFPEDSEPKAK